MVCLLWSQNKQRLFPQTAFNTRLIFLMKMKSVRLKLYDFLKKAFSNWRVFMKLGVVAWRLVAGQRPRDKQIYNSHY
jgi:hypothetical protein